ncbi:MAG: DUF2520 domain-containing protein [Planctomycetes bacterium]|nr:DUF2520 domain-containing protein [Planctomycetota bacterium]
MNFQVAIYGMGRFGRALAGALPAGSLARTGGRRDGVAAWKDLYRRGPEAFLKDLPGGTLVVLSVPDDALETVANEFATLPGAGSLFFVHTSGVRGPEVLEPIADAGAQTGVLHLLQSFPPDGGAGLIRGCYGVVEGGPELRACLSELAAGLGVITIELTDAQRVPYHAAAVLASNALVAMLDAGREMLESAGLPAEQAGKMLLPLARGTLHNVEKLGLHEALTGPVVRGDVGTIRRHLGVLAGDARRTYVAMMLAVADTAERSGRTPPNKLNEIRALLREQP